MAAAGFKEIALTGVHLGSYGRDLTPSSVARVAPARARLVSSADVTFRISSLEPMDCTPEIVALVRRERRPLRAALPPAAAARERPHARA